MINVSSAWHRTLYNDNRNYLERITVTLANNTVINLTNENIWGGAKFDDAVSSDNDFQIGSSIVNKLVFNINNIYENYSEYDFTGAKVVAKIGLVTDVNTEIIKKGTYIVNTASYNGSLINLECYDYMCKFEKQYSESTLVYPATLDTIVRGACTDCGVQLQTLNFPHKTYVIQERPSDENCTYREIISWCAQIAGCFARCNTDGKLEIKWFDQESIGDGVYGLNGGIFDDSSPRYTSGDIADGGNFNPWNTGYEHDSGEFSTPINVHYISSLYSKNISVDDVVITGVKVLIKADGNDAIEPILVGTSGYVIEISNNPFIASTASATEIATWLGTQLIGFKFRKAQITHGSDPSIEAGDVALVIDGKGRTYPIVISHTVFTVGSAQTTTSSAQTPARNSAQRFSNETKNYIELRKAIKNEYTAREQAERELAQAIANAGGLYETTIVDSETGATTYYLHNKTVLNESDIRLMFSDVGITVTADGGQHWYGLTASGDMIAHLLSATGINADWINTGQLVVRDADDNETFFADTATGIVRINASAFTLQGSTIPSIADSAASSAASSAISSYDSSLNQTEVFNKLTNNGMTQGIYLENGKLYINMDYAKSGTITIGARNNIGSLTVLDSTLNVGGYWDGGGLYIGSAMTDPGADYSTRIDDNWLYTDMLTVHQSEEITLDLTVARNTSMVGDLTVHGTKSRSATTKNYSERLLYCYETPSPMFGDVGEGVIGEDGLCYVSIDPVFAETVNTNQYQVFLQAYGDGKCFVKERKSSYFVVQGEIGLAFGWEIKAKQSGYEQHRLDVDSIKKVSTDNDVNYAKEAIAHINHIQRERIIA